MLIIDKNYMFRTTVAIIRFYPKLYAKKGSVYAMCVTAFKDSVYTVCVTAFKGSVYTVCVSA